MRPPYGGGVPRSASEAMPTAATLPSFDFGQRSFASAPSQPATLPSTGPWAANMASGGYPSGLGRSVSHSMQPPPFQLEQFQFKFEAIPTLESDTGGAGSATGLGSSSALGSGSSLGREAMSGTGTTAERTPPTSPPRHAGRTDSWLLGAGGGGAVGSAAPPSSTARGREGVLQRLAKPSFGVTQEPVACTLQLDECIARCRKEVQELAAKSRARGVKYSDPEFPPTDRALYRSGRRPSVPDLAPDKLPARWGRASEGALAGAGGQGSPSRSTADDGRAPEASAAAALVPGPILGAPLPGALAAMRSGGLDPRSLIVWREPEAGIYGVRFFKEGEWMYEVLDDELPLTHSGEPACCRAVAPGGIVQDWPALVEKAFAKVHGSYEAAASPAADADTEALEDVLGLGVHRVDAGEFPVWGELWQHLRCKRRRGYVLLAARRGKEASGETLTNGLLSGFSYPVTRLELIDGEMLCELQDPWPQGRWNGRWSDGSREMASRKGFRQFEPQPGSCKPFWMSIQDFCQHFTTLIEALVVPANWRSVAVTCGHERPSYPLISVSTPTQAIFSASQGDCRWPRGEPQSEGPQGAIGLRVYRCRIVAPPQHAVGVRQNVSSPFRNLELVAERRPAKVRGCMVELQRLEVGCLYIACADLDKACTFATLRVLTACDPRFRELSPPESSYFLQAQLSAPPVLSEVDSFSDGDEEATAIGAAAEASSPRRLDPMRPGVGESWHDWEDTAIHVKLPAFLKSCMTSCSGEC